MTEPLTKRQGDVLRALAALTEELGRTPSGPELAEMLGLSHHSSVYEHLQNLEKKGYIDIVQPGGKRAQTIRFLGPARSLLMTGWAVLGAIPAGPLTEVISEDADFIERVEDLVPDIRKGDFFLEVEGDSMINIGLEPGMLVLCRPDAPIRPGSVCAVWVEGEGGTLKRVFPEGSKVRLQPENDRYEPRVFDAHLVRVQGVVLHGIGVQPIA